MNADDAPTQADVDEWARQLSRERGIGLMVEPVGSPYVVAVALSRKGRTLGCVLDQRGAITMAQRLLAAAGVPIAGVAMPDDLKAKVRRRMRL